MTPCVAATPPSYVTRPLEPSSWSTRASNFGWLAPRLLNAVPNAPVPSAGYAAPPTNVVPVGSLGSTMRGIAPAGLGNASEAKYPPDTRYAHVAFGASA